MKHWAYYNDFEPTAAAWLRELIRNKLIPDGYVDERSITEVTPSDLEGFTQCHFFAGIGGWPLALRMAGVPESTRLWTGSPPCQPFSVAGESLGFDDPRHLAPAFLRLIRECRPERLYGEQVGAAIGKHWLDFVFLNLEEKGYTCGAAVLPACSVGAPHKRERLFFGAHRLAHSSSFSDNKRSYNVEHGRQNQTEQTRVGIGVNCVANSDSERLQRERGDSDPQGWEGQNIRQTGLLNGAGAETDELAYSSQRGRGKERENVRRGIVGYSEEGRPPGRGASGSDNTTGPYHGFWDDADWLGCRDGKFRPVEPGTFPLAHGIPARVGRLRGYGNAIVPQAAAEFIKAFEASVAGRHARADLDDLI